MVTRPALLTRYLAWDRDHNMGTARVWIWHCNALCNVESVAAGLAIIEEAPRCMAVHTER